MKVIPVRTIPVPSREHFVREHLRGVGEPVIITGGIEAWPARTKWTFDYFRARYGKDFGLVPLDFLAKDGSILTRVESYIDYLDQPLSDLPGFLVDAHNRPIAPVPDLDAAQAWNFSWESFGRYPELSADIQPALPFIPDLLDTLSDHAKGLIEGALGYESTSLFLSKRGTITPLHQDHSHTHGRLVQFQGTKQVTLFSPDDSPQLYNGAIDPEHPDLDEFPLLARATAYSGILHPGDILFVPSLWWHHTRSLDHSITLSYNFFNEANLSNFLERMLGKILPRGKEDKQA